MAFLGPSSPQKLPNCERSCGNVNISFPFGSDRCNYSRSFLVTCDRSSGRPIPFLGKTKSNIVIKSISTSTAEMELLMYVANDCYNSSGARIERKRPSSRLSNFRISTKNKFVALGCDTQAYFIGERGNETIRSGCITVCNSKNNMSEGSCSGVGCCEISIPKGMRSFRMSLSSYFNHTNITDFNPCSYAFVTEEGKYTFSPKDLLDFKSQETMPMLVEWAIGNETCGIASKDIDKFLCKGRHSKCDESYTGSGYRCRCLPGYEGNPYIANGCTNINECARPGHGCLHDCVDIPGNYTCSCPKGFSGDGRENGTRCTSNESLIIKISISASAATIFLLILVTWLYLGLKKRKLIILREKFFRQNGGIMLQQRISSDGCSHDQTKVFTAEELKRVCDGIKEIDRATRKLLLFNNRLQ
ncbi:serine/threonine-protein kinase, active site protein [Artemisia annua]|uniref:Serine/threonine-protein kinase, active site protein n=1 Tax=Artemisia annua TaxID=35608 RepID=A0A2U1NYP6_ARTAN|nr:serine/threonine-protein kinase, active site protein [Artemisia annua]